MPHFIRCIAPNIRCMKQPTMFFLSFSSCASFSLGCYNLLGLLLIFGVLWEWERVKCVKKVKKLRWVTTLAEPTEG